MFWNFFPDDSCGQVMLWAGVFIKGADHLGGDR